MRALVYHGPGRHSWDDVPDPAILDPTDALVRIDAVTICGTDLHILRGDLPTCAPGRVLGHEAVGTITQVGSAVRGRAVGDRVLVSCITSCGTCPPCRSGSFGQCVGGGGWVLGHRVDGVQAEQARIPFVDTSTHLLPAAIRDEDALMLADIIPTAYEVGVTRAHVAPGETVVVVGAGPIGLATVVTAQLFSPTHLVVVDPNPARLEAAKRFGATVTAADAQQARDTVAELTEGRGADVAIEAVGAPETFELCTELVRPGGRVANVGVHGKPAVLHLETLWARNLTITTGLVDTYSTPSLLRMMAAGQVTGGGLITHRYGLGEMMDAYDVFSDAATSQALKVALFRV